MKKLITFLLAGVLVFSLAACGDKKGTDDSISGVDEGMNDEISGADDIEGGIVESSGGRG